MTSPLFRKLSTREKNRPFRVVILGQNGVGKSALTVRYLTHRFIGDYDPQLENTYSCTKCIDGETVVMEIRDTAATEENNNIEINIKWADAFVLVYAVTDRCSFNEVSRLKILINSYSNKRVKGNNSSGQTCIPAVLVGNQADRAMDRMVSSAEGREKAVEMNCLGFYEISVREDWDAAAVVFQDLYRQCKRPSGRRGHLQQRLSCPPNVSNLNGEVSDATECSSVPLQRRRKALFTIS